MKPSGVSIFSEYARGKTSSPTAVVYVRVLESKDLQSLKAITVKSDRNYLTRQKKVDE